MEKIALFIIKLLDKLTELLILAFLVVMVILVAFVIRENDNLVQEASSLQYKVFKPTTDEKLSIIYGHNMAGSVMFGDFCLYEDRDYFDSHRTGTIFYDVEYHKLSVLAYFPADGESLPVTAPANSPVGVTASAEEDSPPLWLPVAVLIALTLLYIVWSFFIKRGE